MNDNDKKLDTNPPEDLAENEAAALEHGDAGAEHGDAAVEHGDAAVEHGAPAPEISPEQRLEKKRRLRFGTFATLITIAVVAAVFVLNILVTMITDKFPLSIDLTGDAMFDISDVSKDYIKGLQEDISITVLANEQAVSNSSEYLAQVARTLEAYAKNSSRIKLQYVDLTANPTFISKYPDYDLNLYDVIVETSTRKKVVSINDMLNYSTDNYTGRSTIESSVAEQVMTNALMYVTSGEVTKVVFLVGLGENDSAAFENLLTSNSYDVSKCNILTEEIDPEAAAVVWFGPSKDPGEEYLKKLDAYLEKGGNLFVFTHPLSGALPTLNAFLAEWGLAVTDGIAFETNPSYMLSMTPYFPIVQYTDSEFAGSLAADNSYSAFYILQPVSTLFENKSTITTKTLLSLSEGSGYHATDVSEDYKVQESDKHPNLGVMAMATANNGKVRSNLVLTGSTTSFSADFLTSSSIANAEYIIGVFNKLCERGDAVTIAAKDFTAQPNNMSAGQIYAVMIIFPVLIPLVVFGAGIFVFFRRRHL